MPSDLCLENMPAINDASIKALVDAHPLLDEVCYLPTIDSTNLEARRRRDQSSRKNILILAGEQTAGLGQQGRKWESARGMGIWASLLIQNPSFLQGPLDLVSLYTGVIVCDAIRASGLKNPVLKWPNDILHGERKLGGILTEINWMGNQPGSIIIGLGLNVLHRKEDLPPELQSQATSLLLALKGASIDPLSLTESIVSQLFDGWSQLSDPKGVCARWNASAWALNEQIQMQMNDRIESGQFLGVDQKGRAVVRMKKRDEAFSVGQIRLSRLS